jgi:hypothetical protein
VVSDGGRVHALLLCIGVIAVPWELRLAVPNMADVLEVDEVFACVDWQSGERDEGRGYTVKRSINGCTRRVRMPARKHRIVIC